MSAGRSDARTALKNAGRASVQGLSNKPDEEAVNSLALRRQKLFEQFRPRIGNETVAVRHVDFWQTFGVEHGRFIDDLSLGQDVG